MSKHQAKKYLGQHFLEDAYIIQKMVAMIAPKPGERFIEIGPGLGALTKVLLPLIRRLEVIELDKDLIQPLQTSCAQIGELLIHHQDALTYDFSGHSKTPSVRVVGNLPYNISSPLLFHLIHYAEYIKDMHFMLQKEVVERMAAIPGMHAYGRLSVMLQYHCQIEPLFDVAPEAFRPAPKVNSSVVRLIPYQSITDAAHDYVAFADLVKQAFSQRRKTLRNTLKKICQSIDFEQAHIDPQARAETLSVRDFVRLSNLLVQHR